MKKGPRPSGRPWTSADDEELLALLDLKRDRNLIAWKLRRTVEALGARNSLLKKRGLKLRLKDVI
jgi:hypothetical protein